MSMGVLFACLSVHRVHAWCPRKPGEGARSLETNVTVSCVPLRGCWELNLVFCRSKCSQPLRNLSSPLITFKPKHYTLVPEDS